MLLLKMVVLMSEYLHLCCQAVVDHRPIFFRIPGRPVISLYWWWWMGRPKVKVLGPKCHKVKVLRICNLLYIGGG